MFPTNPIYQRYFPIHLPDKTLTKCDFFFDSYCLKSLEYLYFAIEIIVFYLKTMVSANGKGHDQDRHVPEHTHARVRRCSASARI